MHQLYLPNILLILKYAFTLINHAPVHINISDKSASELHNVEEQKINISFTLNNFSPNLKHKTHASLKSNYKVEIQKKSDWQLTWTSVFST